MKRVLSGIAIAAIAVIERIGVRRLRKTDDRNRRNGDA